MLNYSLIVAFLTLLLRLVQCNWGYYQGFAVEPHSLSINIGRSVIIPCQISHKQGATYWSKDDQFISIERNTFGRKRISIIGSDADGNYSLKIDPVELLDEGEYQCCVSNIKKFGDDLRSRKAYLRVWIPPKPPVIIGADSFYAIEYKMTQLDCVSEGGNPPANIVWLDNKNFTITDNVVYSYTPDREKTTYTATSSITFTPSYLDNNINYTCKAQNSAEKTYQSTSIKLNVLYMPMVHVKIKSGVNSEGLVPRGFDVTFFCKAEANPSKLWYKWYMNSVLIMNNGTSELTIPKVSENHDNAVIKCCVNNSLGKSSSFINLRVKYGPKIRYVQNDIKEKKGVPVTLMCDIVGNPTPKFRWIHKDTSQVVGSKSNLSIVLEENTKGKYECTGTIPGEKSVKIEVNVILLKPPDIVNSQALQDDMGNARLECVASSLSAPNTPGPLNNINWTYNQNIINSNEKNFIIEETEFVNHTLKSVLFIQNVQPENYGTYVCTASNANGVTAEEILLLQIADNKTEMISVSIGGTLLVGATIFFGYFIVRRKYKKYFVFKINHADENSPIYSAQREANSNIMSDSVLSDSIDGISYKNSLEMNCSSSPPFKNGNVFQPEIF